MEYVLEKVLEGDREEVRDDLRKVFYAPTYGHANEAVRIFKGRRVKKYPSQLSLF